ncbi:hypothetical protein JCM15519_18980 [Fundidesulfovibrio butyratiphilus]
MTQQHDPTPSSSSPPRNGPLILLGALGAAAVAAWLLSRILPLHEVAAALYLATGSDGLWTLIGAGLLFPIFFGFMLASQARGVERRPLLLAYGGGIYIVGCAAESYVRGQLTLWPELLVAVCACSALFVLLPKPKPHEEDDAREQPEDDR